MKGWHVQCHGVGVGVEGPNVVLDFGGARRFLIFDEAMDFEGELKRAVRDATENAIDDA